MDTHHMKTRSEMEMGNKVRQSLIFRHSAGQANSNENASLQTLKKKIFKQHCKPYDFFELANMYAILSSCLLTQGVFATSGEHFNNFYLQCLFFLQHRSCVIIHLRKYCKRAIQSNDIKILIAILLNISVHMVRLWRHNCPLYESVSREESAIKVGQWERKEESKGKVRKTGCWQGRRLSRGNNKEITF